MVFPGVTRPLAIGRPKSLAALAAAGQGGLLVIASQRDAETEDPRLADLHPVACIVRVARVIDSRGEGKQAIVVGVARARLVEAVASEPCLRVRIEALTEIDEMSPARDAAWKQVIAKAQRIIELRDDLPDEWKTFVARSPESRPAHRPGCVDAAAGARRAGRAARGAERRAAPRAGAWRTSIAR